MTNDAKKPEAEETHELHSDNIELDKSARAVLEQVEFPKMQMEQHQWRQTGNVVQCMSCASSHAFYLPRGFVLEGFDDKGFPQLLKIA